MKTRLEAAHQKLKEAFAISGRIRDLYFPTIKSILPRLKAE